MNLIEQITATWYVDNYSAFAMQGYSTFLGTDFRLDARTGVIHFTWRPLTISVESPHWATTFASRLNGNTPPGEGLAGRGAP